MEKFTDRVFIEVCKIPYGKVATYKQIAIMCGSPGSARAVGNALHKNPKPIEIPCHRIVNSKGELAKHFAFGGCEAQAILLRKEGITIIDNKVKF